MPFVTRLPALTGADPYPDALLALDFVGSRRGPQYYKALGVTTADITKIPGWTYTGGASTGSYAAKADGSLQLFANNVPRITDAGYWAEEARTNLLLRSQEFDNAAWATAFATITANQSTAPDGATTADRIAETAASNQHGVYQSLTLSANTVYTSTYYVKAQERTWAYIQINRLDGSFPRAWFNLSTGAVGTVQAGLTATIAPSSNGFYRISVSFDSLGASSGAVSTRLLIARSDGDVTYLGETDKGILAWQADLQAGSFATSPIPTTSVAVTRAADVGSVTVSPGVNQTTVASYTQLASALSDGVFRFFPVAIGSYIGATGVNTSNTGWYASGLSGVGASYNGNNTVAVATSAGGNFTASRNGGSPVTSASSDYTGSATRVDVGLRGAAGVPLSGPIRRIVIYPRAFANSELQAITTAGAY